MNRKKAKELWEDVLINKTGNNAIKRLGLTKEQANVFLSHTMPEMFVDSEITRLHLKKLEELKKKEKKMRHLMEQKQSSSIGLTIGIFMYVIIITPTLFLIASFVHF